MSTLASNHTMREFVWVEFSKEHDQLFTTPGEWLSIEWDLVRADALLDNALGVLDGMYTATDSDSRTPRLYVGWKNVFDDATDCATSTDIRQYRRLYNIYYFFALVAECLNIVKRIEKDDPSWRIDRIHSVYTTIGTGSTWENNVHLIIDAIKHGQSGRHIVLTINHLHQDLHYMCDLLRWLGKSQNSDLILRDALFEYYPPVAPSVIFPSAGVPEAITPYLTNTALQHKHEQTAALFKLARYLTNNSGKVFKWLARLLKRKNADDLDKRAHALCKYDIDWFENVVLTLM